MMKITDAITDITGDPAGEYFTLTHFSETSVMFNAPVANEVADLLKEEGYDVEVEGPYQLSWDDDSD
jgi:hypothetical protein